MSIALKEWLVQQSMEGYAGGFAALGVVDLISLSKLEASDVSTLGIAKGKERRRVLGCISKLKDQLAGQAAGQTGENGSSDPSRKHTDVQEPPRTKSRKHVVLTAPNEPPSSSIAAGESTESEVAEITTKRPPANDPSPLSLHNGRSTPLSLSPSLPLAKSEESASEHDPLPVPSTPTDARDDKMGPSAPHLFHTDDASTFDGTKEYGRSEEDTEIRSSNSVDREHRRHEIGEPEPSDSHPTRSSKRSKRSLYSTTASTPSQPSNPHLDSKTDTPSQIPSSSAASSVPAHSPSSNATSPSSNTSNATSSATLTGTSQSTQNANSSSIGLSTGSKATSSKGSNGESSAPSASTSTGESKALEGQLQVKKGGFLRLTKKWEPRWCTFEGRVFQAFKNKDDKVPVVHIDITKAIVTGSNDRNLKVLELIAQGKRSHWTGPSISTWIKAMRSMSIISLNAKRRTADYGDMREFESAASPRPGDNTTTRMAGINALEFDSSGEVYQSLDVATEEEDRPYRDESPSENQNRNHSSSRSSRRNRGGIVDVGVDGGITSGGGGGGGGGEGKGKRKNRTKGVTTTTTASAAASSSMVAGNASTQAIHSSTQSPTIGVEEQNPNQSSHHHSHHHHHHHHPKESTTMGSSHNNQQASEMIRSPTPTSSKSKSKSASHFHVHAASTDSTSLVTSPSSNTITSTTGDNGTLNSITTHHRDDKDSKRLSDNQHLLSPNFTSSSPSPHPSVPSNTEAASQLSGEGGDTTTTIASQKSPSRSNKRSSATLLPPSSNISGAIDDPSRPSGSPSHSRHHQNRSHHRNAAGDNSSSRPLFPKKTSSVGNLKTSKLADEIFHPGHGIGGGGGGGGGHQHQPRAAFSRQSRVLFDDVPCKEAIARYAAQMKSKAKRHSPRIGPLPPSSPRATGKDATSSSSVAAAAAALSSLAANSLNPQTSANSSSYSLQVEESEFEDPYYEDDNLIVPTDAPKELLEGNGSSNYPVHFKRPFLQASFQVVAPRPTSDHKPNWQQRYCTFDGLVLREYANANDAKNGASLCGSFDMLHSKVTPIYISRVMCLEIYEEESGKREFWRGVEVSNWLPHLERFAGRGYDPMLGGLLVRQCHHDESQWIARYCTFNGHQFQSFRNQGDEVPIWSSHIRHLSTRSIKQGGGVELMELMLDGGSQSLWWSPPKGLISHLVRPLTTLKHVNFTTGSVATTSGGDTPTLASVLRATAPLEEPEGRSFKSDSKGITFNSNGKVISSGNNGSNGGMGGLNGNGVSHNGGNNGISGNGALTGGLNGNGGGNGSHGPLISATGNNGYDNSVNGREDDEDEWQVSRRPSSFKGIVSDWISIIREAHEICIGDSERYIADEWDLDESAADKDGHSSRKPTKGSFSGISGIDSQTLKSTLSYKVAKKNWEPRFLELSGRFLHLYKKKHDKKPEHSFKVSKCKIAINRSNDAKHPETLEITFDDHTHIFRGKNLIQWHDTLVSLSGNHPSLSSSGHVLGLNNSALININDIDPNELSAAESRSESVLTSSRRGAREESEEGLRDDDDDDNSRSEDLRRDPEEQPRTASVPLSLLAGRKDITGNTTATFAGSTPGADSFDNPLGGSDLASTATSIPPISILASPVGHHSTSSVAKDKTPLESNKRSKNSGPSHPHSLGLSNSLLNHSATDMSSDDSSSGPLPSPSPISAKAFKLFRTPTAAIDCVKTMIGLNGVHEVMQHPTSYYSDADDNQFAPTVENMPKPAWTGPIARYRPNHHDWVGRYIVLRPKIDILVYLSKPASIETVPPLATISLANVTGTHLNTIDGHQIIEIHETLSIINHVPVQGVNNNLQQTNQNQNPSSTLSSNAVGGNQNPTSDSPPPPPPTSSSSSSSTQINKDHSPTPPTASSNHNPDSSLPVDTESLGGGVGGGGGGNHPSQQQQQQQQQPSARTPSPQNLSSGGDISIAQRQHLWYSSDAFVLAELIESSSLAARTASAFSSSSNNANSSSKPRKRSSKRQVPPPSSSSGTPTTIVEKENRNSAELTKHDVSSPAPASANSSSHQARRQAHKLSNMSGSSPALDIPGRSSPTERESSKEKDRDNHKEKEPKELKESKEPKEHKETTKEGRESKQENKEGKERDRSKTPSKASTNN